MEGIRAEYENDFNLFEYFYIKTLNNVDQLDNAIYYKDNVISFKQVNGYIRKINNFIYESVKDKLIENNSDRNKIIGIHLDPDHLTVPTILAIHSLSCPYLPIDPQLPNERMEYIIKDSNPICIVTNKNDNTKLANIINGMNIQLIDLNKIFNQDNNSDLVYQNLKKFDSNDLACILYTSGSTGLPKGVCLSHFSIMNRINWQWNTFETSAGDIGSFKTSLNFVDHLSEIFSFILKGLPIVVIDHESLTKIDDLIDILHKNKITYFVLVPSLLRNILYYAKTHNKSSNLYSIKRWICSGETLSADLINLFFDVFSDKNLILNNFYGSTEVTADVTYISFESVQQFRKLLFENSNVPIGRPISNSRITLFDENMNEINKEKELGEIYASGSCLATGYLNESDSNKFVIINGARYFKTGDFGFIYNELLYYTGRNDSQIKIRGKRMNLIELEHYALKVKGIQSFIPLIYDFDNENKIIIAFYKSNLTIGELKINELIIDTLKSFIFDYMLPAYMFKLDQIPLLYNGKVDKQLLKKLFIEKYFPVIQPTKLNQSKEFSIENLISEISKITQVDLNRFISSDIKNLRLDELGISSINAILIYLSIDIINRCMKFDEFLSQKTFGDLMANLKNYFVKEKEKKTEEIDLIAKLNLDEMAKNLEIHTFFENENFSTMVLKMMSETYSKKNILHNSFPEYQNQQLFDFYYPFAELLKSSKESFIVFNKTKNKYVGGAYIFDDDIHLEIEVPNEYYKSFEELLETDKNKIAKKVKENNKKLLYSSFVTTSLEADFIENIILINYMEDKIIEMAKKFNYNAIISVNTNKLTKEIGLKYKGYKLEKEIQINQFENSSGVKYFSKIPDSHSLAICVKYLN